MSFSQQALQATLQPARRGARGRALRRVPIYTYQTSGGLGSLSGNGEGRPTIDYVKAGDVIRVYVAYDAGLYFGGAGIGAAFVRNLSSAFNVVKAPGDTSGFFERAWAVDVQPRSDYSKLQDAVSVVLNAAQRAGLNVNAATSYGQFLSKVETTGGTPPVTIESPGGASQGGASGVGDTVSDFISNLTKSPVTLAVILGAAVILVIAAKK